MSVSRRFLHLLVLSALLGLMTVWAFSRLSRQHAAAQEAAGQLAEARQLIGQIQTLRQKPVLAGVQEVALTDLNRRLEQTATAAGLQRSQLEDIATQTPRRLGSSPYQVVLTQVQLRQVSLEQLSRFLVQLAHDPQPLRVSALRLTVPHDLGTSASSPGPNRWTIELTLTYLLYAPLASE